MEFTPIEKEFLNILLDGTNLSEIEWKAKFGNDLDNLRLNLEIRRIVANKKIQESRRKNLVSRYRLEQMVSLIPKALETLKEIMENGKEHNRLVAAQTIARIPASYLEKHGVKIAEAELENESQSANIQLTYNLDEYKPDAN